MLLCFTIVSLPIELTLPKCKYTYRVYIIKQTQEKEKKIINSWNEITINYNNIFL